VGLQLLEVSHKLMVGYCSPHGWLLPFILYHFRYPLWLWNFKGINLSCLFVQLKAGNGEDIFTCNGRWNFNNKVSMYSIFFLVYVDCHDVTCNILNSIFRGSLELVVLRNGQWSTFLHDAMLGILSVISSSVEA